MRQPRLLTLGLGNRSIDEALKLLDGAGCRLVADVRENPASVLPVHFSRSPLTRAIETAGMNYRWFRELGRPGEGGHPVGHILSSNPQASRFVTRLNEAPFQSEIEELAGVAASTSVVMISNEPDPRRSHRWVLSDLLFVRGVRVVHILDAVQDDEHTVTPELEIDRRGMATYVERQLGLKVLP